MCDPSYETSNPGTTKIPVQDSIGTILAHDITEIRPGEFKGRAFKKGHIIKEEDVCRLRRLGKENLFVSEYRRRRDARGRCSVCPCKCAFR